MKKSLLTTMLFSLLSLTLSGQTQDTLFYGDEPVVIENPFGWGYMAGTNEYLDNGKYQRFDFFTQGYVVGAMIYFGVNKIVNGPDPITVVVRDVGSDSGPSGILESFETNTAAFDTNGTPTTIWFQNPVEFQGGGFIQDSLFIGIEWVETNDDTFAIFLDPDSLGDLANRPWERFVDGAFNDFTAIVYNPDYSWLIDTDMWIAAIISDVPTGVNYKNDIPSNFELEQNYPNPFNPSTRIEFSVPEKTGVTIVVCDALGSEISTLLSEELPAGNHYIDFNAGDLASGLYLYRISAGNFAAVKKMMLLK